MPSPMGCAEGLAPCLIGEFSAIRQYCGSDKFPNKLRYFLRKYPAACRLSAHLPFGGGCPCRLLTHITPPYFFPFGWWVAGQNLLQYGQVNGVSCPLLIIADFTFPIFDGVQPVALLSVRTNIPVLVRWCVGMLVCCYAGMWIYYHACQCFSGMQPVNSGTNTVVFSFCPCIILSSNALRTFAAPNDSTRKARAAIVSRS